MYSVTKTYGHERGLSCCFRQHGATSHCRTLHGYALAFAFEICADELDDNNWVFDFGGLKPLKLFLDSNFDHRLVCAEDDPSLNLLRKLEESGLASLLILDRVGCEAFAEYAGDVARQIVDRASGGRAWLASCKVSEHGSNSATRFYARP